MSYKCSDCGAEATLVERFIDCEEEVNFILSDNQPSDEGISEYSLCNKCAKAMNDIIISNGTTFLQPIDDYSAFYAMVKL